jgi:NADH dehydrogenase
MIFSNCNWFGDLIILKKLSATVWLWKSIPQSLNISSLILENFEQAVLTKDVAEQK